MAERSFKKEVRQLVLSQGEEFVGEGILAVTKALLQSGVAYVGGYQGSPVSHLMDVLADARETLDELGVHFESNTSEAAAAAMLGASVHYPVRGAITFKSTVGTNVAADALSNLASGGVTGGTLVILGEDYGEGSSIIQERSHAFAMKSQMWLLDPRPNLPSIVDAVEKSFELSEASNTPVMMTMRVRACHMHGRFTAATNRRPEMTLKEATEQPRRDVQRMALAPATFVHEHEKVKDRWPAAVNFVREHRMNEVFDADAKRIDVGIMVQGGLYNTLLRALELLGLADAFGNNQLPIYVMNVVYPMVDDEVLDFMANKQAVLMMEEGQPEYIEQSLHTLVRRQGVETLVHGKDMLPLAGEYTVQAMLKGLRKFLERYPHAGEEVTLSLPTDVEQMLKPKVVPIVPSMPGTPMVEVPEVQPRPPGFCTGCPERPIFAALKLVEKDTGPHYISADIGCHQFAALPPFNVGATSMGYGLGAAGASAFNVEGGRRTISVMGDGGFWHNGLTTGVANAVFNENDNVILLIDNGYSAATGGQDIPSSHRPSEHRSTQNSIEAAVRGVGAKWVRTIDNTYDLARMTATLREALTTEVAGPKVVIAQSECMLNKQRRERPKKRERMRQGERTVVERFGVDSDTCTGDHSCIRLSGCPSLSIRDNPDPLRRDPVATVLSSCVGCGHCGEVAHAAVLCPSFYRAEVIHHPNLWERWYARLSSVVIGFLQKRLAAREWNHAG